MNKKTNLLLGLIVLFAVQVSKAERWSINNKSSQSVRAHFVYEGNRAQNVDLQPGETKNASPNEASMKIASLSFSPNNNLRANGAQDYAIPAESRNLFITLEDVRPSGGGGSQHSSSTSGNTSGSYGGTIGGTGGGTHGGYGGTSGGTQYN